MATSTAFAGRALARRPRVAAVFTVCTHRTHAHVILENFLKPYFFNGQETDPGVDVVSFYADQTPSGDMSTDIGRQFKIPIFKTIDEALCVGGEELAVDAVLSIGEHGSYPVNELGQRQYPRKRFFDEIVAVMRRSKRFVPLFNDKHLSYRWDEAKAMYDEAKELGIPLMAGSSVPLAQRRPPLQLPRGAEFEEAVSIHGGPLESYDFHALEVLQSMIESRQGGEAGVASVELISGDAVWAAADDGRWSRELAEAAMTAEFGKPLTTLKQIEGEEPYEPHCILVKYKDGLQATVLKIGHDSTRWNFACRLKGDPEIKATSFYVGPWENRNLFKALSHAIQHHFIHGEAPYAAERTLLVTGVLESAMRSRKQAGTPVLTPHLTFGYRSADFTAMREMGESWKIITEDIPEPRGINPNGLRQ
ncbi:MAG: hypothetical protein H8E66_17035 [Planctomycetes bacterium]|nr:hypothetical protein [Planctomycetota bacterium]